MVPRWRLAGAVDFNRALAAGRAQTLDEVTLTHDDLAFLQYTGGTTGVAKGSDAHPRQHGGERAAGRGLDVAQPAATARRPWSSRCRCTTCSH